jgi:hypothetical protein
LEEGKKVRQLIKDFGLDKQQSVCDVRDSSIVVLVEKFLVIFDGNEHLVVMI